MPTLTVPAMFAIWLACAAVSLVAVRLYAEEGKKGVATVLLVSATVVLMVVLEALKGCAVFALLAAWCYLLWQALLHGDHRW